MKSEQQHQKRRLRSIPSREETCKNRRLPPTAVPISRQELEKGGCNAANLLVWNFFSGH